jgi:NAD(P)H-dependent FMN reductase
MLKIQVITGTTRPGALNPQVAEWITDFANERDDLDVELVRISDYNLPVLDEPISAAQGKYQNEHTRNFAAKIAEADGYIFVTPEYNHSIPGSLKNAIDCVYGEWNNKAAGIVNYGFAANGARAAEHLRSILSELQVAHVRSQVSISIPESFENYSTFKPTDKNLKSANTMLDQLVSWGTALKSVRVDVRLPVGI